MKYIINADDFGRTETVNKAITEGFKNGFLNRTTIMVNMDNFNEAVELSKKFGFFNKVGLHINILSGTPLTDKIKIFPIFCDSYGNFNGAIFKKHFPRLFISKRAKNALYDEILAQISLYKKAGFTLMHADSHGHTHTFLSILGVFKKALKKEKFSSLRISANVHGSFLRRVYKKFLNYIINKFNISNKYLYFDSLVEILEDFKSINSKDGVCEIMLHPNIFNGEIQIGQSKGYKDIPNEILSNLV